MAIGTISFSEWLKKNPSVVSNAIKDNFLQVARTDLVNMMNQYLTALGDGVFIGKNFISLFNEEHVMQPWQTAPYGIDKADADCIVVQYGGYRLGIALDESPISLEWGSNKEKDYNTPSEMNSFNGYEIMKNIMKDEAIINDDPSQYAMAYAWNYSKSHDDDGGISTIGAHIWRLPTMADISLIDSNFENINLAIDRINAAGKQEATKLSRSHYWSCQANGHTSGLYYLGASTRSYFSRDFFAKARPVITF